MADHNVDAALQGEADFISNFAGSLPVSAALVGGSELWPILATLPPPILPVAVGPVGPDSVCGWRATQYADNAVLPFRAETQWGTRRFYQGLPNAIATLTTMGAFLLEQWPMRTGSVRAQVVAGASGGTILELSDGGKQITIALDGSSRAGIILTDTYGSPVAQAAPWGAAIAQGALIDVQLSWNANTGQVSFLVNGQPPAVWANYPTGPWDAFQPAVAIVGPTGGFTVRQVQVAKTP